MLELKPLWKFSLFQFLNSKRKLNSRNHDNFTFCPEKASKLLLYKQ